MGRPFLGYLGAPVTSLDISSAIEAIYQLAVARIDTSLTRRVDSVVRTASSLAYLPRGLCARASTEARHSWQHKYNVRYAR